MIKTQNSFEIRISDFGFPNLERLGVTIPVPAVRERNIKSVMGDKESIKIKKLYTDEKIDTKFILR